MASLQQIENELKAINDAAFQELGDEYLYYSEGCRVKLKRTGTASGKRKTKAGTPDTYWKLQSGKYVFVEYTTKERKESKAAFIQKLRSDLLKCLDAKITGVALNKVDKIILCFNADITAKEEESLNQLTAKSKIKLVTIGLQTLAMDLYNQFPALAARHLPVSIDTGQILHIEDFLFENKRDNPFATPLVNSFFFREEEQRIAAASLATSELVALTGPPGVGKSRLALKIVADWQEGYSDYEVFCLSNKNAPIFEDLKARLLAKRNYLVFIDDANRQTLNLLTILPLLRSRKGGELKILVTVRDYALPFIEKQCAELEWKKVELKPFDDEQIKSLLKSKDFDIQNMLFINRIIEIAKGNPRVAIMAARLAKQKQNLNALHNLFDLYDAYFKSFEKDHEILSQPPIQKALGLVAFFFSLDFSDKKMIKLLLKSFKLKDYELKESLVQLEKLELVENRQGLFYRISDQVLSTYFFYKTFVLDKSLDFSVLLENFFESHKNRFTDTLAPASRDFGYEKVVQPLEPVFHSFFTSIKHDYNKAFAFLKAFWFCLPDQALAFLDDVIRSKPVEKNARFAIDHNNNNHGPSNNQILSLLNGFLHQLNSLVNDALGLAFEYVMRNPEHYDALYRTLRYAFSFSYEEERYRFYRQQELVNFLLKHASTKNPIYHQMFFALFPHLMETSLNVTSSGYKRDTISFYRYKIPSIKPIQIIRRKIWRHAIKWFEKTTPFSEEAIFSYLKPSMDFEKEILRLDLPYLLALIKKHFDKTKFTHCYFVQTFITRFTKLGITDDDFSEVRAQFYSWEYKVYKLINMDQIRGKEMHEFDDLDFDKFERLKEVEIRYKLQIRTLEEFIVFYQAFCQIVVNPHTHLWNGNNSLDIVLAQALQLDDEECFKMLEYIRKQKNPTGFVPTQVFRAVAHEQKALLPKVYKLLSENDFPARPDWIQRVLWLIAEEDVTVEWYHLLIEIYQLSANSYFDFSYLDKLQRFDERIFETVLTLFVAKSEGSANQRIDRDFFERNCKHFEKNLPLLKKAYFICQKTQQYFDHDGKGLLEILRLDRGFLLEYVQHFSKDAFSISVREHDQLSVIWQLPKVENEVEQLFLYLADKRFYFVREDFTNALFKDLQSEEKKKAKRFLFNLIKKYTDNISIIDQVMDVMRNSLREYYFQAIKQFLQLNSNPKHFKQIKLLNSFFMSSGGTIWADVRATELSQILSEVEKMEGSYKFIQHKAYLRSCIVAEQQHAEQERTRKFFSERW